MSTKTGQRMVGINVGTNARVKNDFYPTPKSTTEALLEKESFNNDVWECACGEGDMSKVLIEKNYNVFSSDLIDRGYGIVNFDFLNDLEIASKNLIGKYDIITNPPFSLANQFILQAKKLAKRKVAILGRINLLEGVERYEKIFKDATFPLARVYPFVRRQQFLTKGREKGANLMFFAWFVWDKEHKGEPSIIFLDK